MNIELNTNIFPCINLNTEELEFPDDYLADTNGNKNTYTDLLLSTGETYIKDCVGITSEIAECLDFEIYSDLDDTKKHYIGFVLVLDDNELKSIISSYSNDDEFIKFIETYYKAVPGYKLNLATTKDEFDKQDADLSLAEILLYNIKDNLENIQQSYTMDVEDKIFIDSFDKFTYIDETNDGKDDYIETDANLEV